jgi:hypothetical protein
MTTRTALIGFLFCFAAHPAWALRCGHELVKDGDHLVQVLRKCGDPVYTAHRIEYRAVRLRQPGLDFERYVPVEIEEWTYDFGPSRFMQVLRFENGRLIEIDSLGYGSD